MNPDLPPEMGFQARIVVMDIDRGVGIKLEVNPQALAQQVTKDLGKVPEEIMTIHTTYTNARAQLATLLDAVTTDHEVVIIQRRGAEDVALIAAVELTGLLETAHLLRSPRNAEQLLSALARAHQREGTPQTVEDIRHEIGLEAVSEHA